MLKKRPPYSSPEAVAVEVFISDFMHSHKHGESAYCLRPATGAVMVPLGSLEPSTATTDSVVVGVTTLGNGWHTGL